MKILDTGRAGKRRVLLDGKGGVLTLSAEPVFLEIDEQSLIDGTARNSAGQPFDRMARCPRCGELRLVARFEPDENGRLVCGHEECEEKKGA